MAQRKLENLISVATDWRQCSRSNRIILRRVQCQVRGSMSFTNRIRQDASRIV